METCLIVATYSLERLREQYLVARIGAWDKSVGGSLAAGSGKKENLDTGGSP